MCGQHARIGVIRRSRDGLTLLGCYPVVVGQNIREPHTIRIGHLLASYDLASLKADARKQIIRQGAFTWLLFALMVTTVGLVLRYSLARRRVDQLVETAHRIAAGDMNSRVELTGGDEIATIGQAFNQMATELQTSTYQLKENEERWRVAHELSLDAFTILQSIRNEQGEIVDFAWTYVNPMAAKLLRRPLERLMRSRLLQVLPGNLTNSALFQEYVNIVETGVSLDREHFYDADGITGWFRNMTVKLGDGVANTFRDITERKHTEAALQRAHDELDQRVQERTAELSHANAALRESEERFTMVFRESPTAMTVNSLPDLRFMAVNETMLRLTGYRSEELLGRRLEAVEILVDTAQTAQWRDELVNTTAMSHSMNEPAHPAPLAGFARSRRGARMARSSPSNSR